MNLIRSSAIFFLALSLFISISFDKSTIAASNKEDYKVLGSLFIPSISEKPLPAMVNFFNSSYYENGEFWLKFIYEGSEVLCDHVKNGIKEERQYIIKRLKCWNPGVLGFSLSLLVSSEKMRNAIKGQTVEYVPPSGENYKLILRGGVIDNVAAFRGPDASEVEPEYERKVSPAPDIVEPKAAPDPTVAKVQSLLKSLGFEVGPVDGLYGPQTREAIRKFQLAFGLSPTGEIDERLLGALSAAVRVAERSSEPVTEADTQQDKSLELAGAGTGFIVSADGYAVTNYHVVEGCSALQARSTDLQAETVTIAAYDQENDLALLKLSDEVDTSAPIRSGSYVRPGDDIVVVGYPFYGQLSTSPSVTDGTVTRLSGLGDDTRFIQLSAQIQPGNSGGPVLDLSGNLVGVVTSTVSTIGVAEATGAIPQNINFAIKSRTLESFLEARLVEYETATSTERMSVADVAASAFDYTFVVECYM